MEQEIITRVKLTASSGMVITNGETFGTVVYLASDVNPEDWYEITEEEYNSIVEKQLKDVSEE